MGWQILVIGIGLLFAPRTIALAAAARRGIGYDGDHRSLTRIFGRLYSGSSFLRNTDIKTILLLINALGVDEAYKGSSSCNLPLGIRVCRFHSLQTD